MVLSEGVLSHANLTSKLITQSTFSGAILTSTNLSGATIVGDFRGLEDQTGRLPVALPPRIAMELHRLLRTARIIAVNGRVEQVRWYRSLLAVEIHAIAHIQPFP